MRWAAQPRGLYHPWFAFLPLRNDDGRVVWMERIWVRDACMYVEWALWEERPNDAIWAKWNASYPEATEPRSQQALSGGAEQSDCETHYKALSVQRESGE
jgi:hypothetical protein